MAEAPTRSTDGIDAGQLLGYFEERRDEMVELIVKLASIESPSRVADAQEPMRSALTAEYDALGLAVRRLEGEDGCDHLMARPTDRDPSRPTQLLLGHLDTVWPVGTLARMARVTSARSRDLISTTVSRYQPARMLSSTNPCVAVIVGGQSSRLRRSGLTAWPLRPS